MKLKFREKKIRRFRIGEKHVMNLLLVDPNAVLEEIGIREDDAILVEVRFFFLKRG